MIVATIPPLVCITFSPFIPCVLLEIFILLLPPLTRRVTVMVLKVLELLAVIQARVLVRGQ